MKLQHYLGGLEDLGPVSTETRVFVEPWEKRIFGIHAAMMALSSHLDDGEKTSTFRNKWTWADLRTGAESMNPFDYFKYRYYEKWLGGISSFFIDEGYITDEELNELTEKFMTNSEPDFPSKEDNATDARIEQYLIEGDSPRKPIEPSYQFSDGQTVSIKDPPSKEHTRLPGFLRNKTGIIDHVYEGAYGYLTDIEEDGIGPGMPVHCVKFDPKEIWPGNTEDNFYLYADLYEAYIK